MSNTALKFTTQQSWQCGCTSNIALKYVMVVKYCRRTYHGAIKMSTVTAVKQDRLFVVSQRFKNLHWPIKESRKKSAIIINIYWSLVYPDSLKVSRKNIQINGSHVSYVLFPQKNHPEGDSTGLMVSGLSSLHCTN
jgi:hypothetical protein